MILPSVFLLLLTIIVVFGLILIKKADMHDKEKRDSILLISCLFIVVLILNEVQNFHLKNPITQSFQYSKFVDLFPVNDIFISEYDETSQKLTEQILQNQTFNGFPFDKNYTQLFLVKTAQVEKLDQFIGNIRYKLDQDGIPTAQVKFSEQSQMFWDKSLAQTVYQQVMEFSKKQQIQGKPIPTLFVEVIMNDKLNDQSILWPQLLTTAYLQEAINVIFYGSTQSIDQLNIETETFYWHSRVLEIDFQ